MLHFAEDNEARIVGVTTGAITLSHEVHTERFYRFFISCSRLSENTDTILVTVSERLLADIHYEEGLRLEINGQFRSYNNYSGEGSKLILTLFARSITLADDDAEDENEIYLNGYICKPVVYRVTPFGREIADILIAVNRAYNKSDYIPAIAWGRNAKFAGTLDVGTNIKVFGRMQSREYQKKLSETESVTKTAYEVSVSRLDTKELTNCNNEEYE